MPNFGVGFKGNLSAWRAAVAGIGVTGWRAARFFSKAETIFSAVKLSWSIFCKSWVAQAGSSVGVVVCREETRAAVTGWAVG